MSHPISLLHSEKAGAYPTHDCVIPVIGQISASLTSFSRTIDDYSELAKRELIPAKQEKAHERIKTFRAELLEYRQYLDRLKKDREDTVREPLIVLLTPLSS